MMTTCVAGRRRGLWLNDMEEVDLDFGRLEFNRRTRAKDKVGQSQQQLNHVKGRICDQRPRSWATESCNWEGKCPRERVNILRDLPLITR